MIGLTARILFTAGLLLFALSSVANTLQAQSENKDTPKRKEKDFFLQNMHKEIRNLTVLISPGKKQIQSRRKSKPLFRYSDQPRGILDATLWGWGEKGRPVALSKLEVVRAAGGEKLWQYCVVSLSNAPLQTKWSQGRRFFSRKSGVNFQRISDGPKPAKTPNKRLFQLKRLARRFHGTIYVDGSKDLKQEMRFLPRPIHRYSDEPSGLLDGAIFGFATNGTNPDLLLVIELQQNSNGNSEWQYSLARMTTGELHVRLDEDEVWKVPGNGPFDTWFYLQFPRKN